MSKSGQLFFITALCVFTIACASGENSPTIPSSGGYDGQWSGTTSQGRTITFTISPDQKVTAITAGYSFSGCSGSNTFSNLNLDIGTPPNPASPSGPGFGFGSGPPDGPDYTQVYGSFSSGSTATGTVIFGDYSGCGNGIRHLECQQALSLPRAKRAALPASGASRPLRRREAPRPLPRVSAVSRGPTGERSEPPLRRREAPRPLPRVSAVSRGPYRRAQRAGPYRGAKRRGPYRGWRVREPTGPYRRAPRRAAAPTARREAPRPLPRAAKSAAALPASGASRPLPRREAPRPLPRVSEVSRGPYRRAQRAGPYRV